MQQLKIPVWDHNTLNICFVLGEETETMIRDMALCERTVLPVLSRGCTPQTQSDVSALKT